MTAIILAGGRSSRMGSPKALLAFDDEPLIAHIVRRLQPLFSRIVIVAAPGQDLPRLSVTVVHDEVPNQGPVGGICYGLRATEDEAAFVTSCDSAFASTMLIAHLISRLDSYDVVVPRWGGRLQPLVAVYRRSVLPHLEKQLADGELRPVTLFDRVKTLEVQEDEIRQHDPDGSSFFNMNEPRDYAEALKRWRGPADGHVACSVELFGAARMLARRREVRLALPAGSTITDVFRAVVAEVPSLAGAVIAADGSRLVEGYTCNVNGLKVDHDASRPVEPGDVIAILAADSGG